MVGSGVYYLHDDALGSVRMTTTPSASIAYSSEYTPYGRSYAMVGVEALMYTGKLLDEATGLYYEGARYYDPTTGRFITEDSVVGSTSGSMSLNRYVYARDNPMKIVDMNGHEWWDPVANLVSAAVGDVAGAATDLANAASNAWNSLPPQDQAIVTTAVIDVGAVAGSVACPACAPTLIGAAVGATAYTITAGSSATASGAIAFTAVGALGGGLGSVTSASAPILTATAEGGIDLADTAAAGLVGHVATGITTLQQVWQASLSTRLFSEGHWHQLPK